MAPDNICVTISKGARIHYAQLDIEIRRVVGTPLGAIVQHGRRRDTFTHFSLEQVELRIARLASHSAGFPRAACPLHVLKTISFRAPWDTATLRNRTGNDRHWTFCIQHENLGGEPGTSATAVTTSVTPLEIDSTAMLLSVQHGDKDYIHMYNVYVYESKGEKKRKRPIGIEYVDEWR